MKIGEEYVAYSKIRHAILWNIPLQYLKKWFVNLLNKKKLQKSLNMFVRFEIKEIQYSLDDFYIGLPCLRY